MFPTLFEIGSFRLGTYGVMMAIGALVSIKLASRESERAGMNKDQFYNFAVYCLLGSIAGARLLYIIVEWDEFLKAPLGMLFAREGFVFLGGFLTGVLVGWWYVRKLRLGFLRTADFIAP
ncbi:MAG TPA: prolipoprotein diacylglyceryl transferase, partial [bacterium]|nr:prolipoprotein diacylglyceryl transferase [bacterium]